MKRDSGTRYGFFFVLQNYDEHHVNFIASSPTALHFKYYPGPGKYTAKSWAILHQAWLTDTRLVVGVHNVAIATIALKSTNSVHTNFLAAAIVDYAFIGIW